MIYVIWFIIGLVAVLPLLVFANRLPYKALNKLFGVSLIVAAVIYIVFALLWGNMDWVVVELAGVGVYGLFYYLSTRYSLLWLAAGWLFHPVWDVMLHLLGPGKHVAPEWYAVACMSFDFAVAAYIVYRELSVSKQLNPRTEINT